MKTLIRNTAAMPITFVWAIALAACGHDAPSPLEPTTPSLSLLETAQLCHQPERGGQVLEVPGASVAAHLAHGDYLTRYEVDPSLNHVDNVAHFEHITDALLAARQVRIGGGELQGAACRITIEVAAGAFVGSFDPEASPALERYPLIIDVPDITLRGALRMKTDARGRPTGEARPGSQVTSLAPDRPIQFMPDTEAMIVVAGHPGGSAGDGAVIEGFAFRSGRSDDSSGGMGIIALRARRLVIRGNRFEAGLSSAADLRSSSAVVEANHGSHLGVSCGICLAGPGKYTASDNRLIDGGLGGIYVAAAIAHLPFSLGASPVTDVEPDVLPDAAEVNVVIRNNDVRGHVRLPIGFAVRALGLGLAASDVQQTTRVLLADNEMVGNTFGLIVDGGFPQANTLARGDIDLDMSGNLIRESCQVDLLVAFTRHTGGLGLTTNPFLKSSVFRLDLGGDLTWGDAWFSHPGGFDNTLIVDGQPIANGIRRSYDASTCPGRSS